MALPRSADAAEAFWRDFARAYAEGYGLEPGPVEFRQGDGELVAYPPADQGTCVLFSGGIESTYLSLVYPDAARFMLRDDAEVHPRGGEMFIKARASGFAEVLYGGNEREWGERKDGGMWDRRSGRWVVSEAFEFIESFRHLWGQYLGLRIRCPTEPLYKDEILAWIFETSPEAYYSLQSCFMLERGWCGYCDKCLITGSIIDALRLPRLFSMKASRYSEDLKKELATYRTGDYDPYWRLPILRRLQDMFGYSLRV